MGHTKYTKNFLIFIHFAYCNFSKGMVYYNHKAGSSEE